MEMTLVHAYALLSLCILMGGLLASMAIKDRDPRWVLAFANTFFILGGLLIWYREDGGLAQYSIFVGAFMIAQAVVFSFYGMWRLTRRCLARS